MPVLSETEIDEFERSINARLPTLYRSLLQEVGAGKYGEHSEIYHPNEIYALFEQFLTRQSKYSNPTTPLVATTWIRSSGLSTRGRSEPLRSGTKRFRMTGRKKNGYLMTNGAGTTWARPMATANKVRAQT